MEVDEVTDDVKNVGKEKKCYKCNKPGHFARDCRVKSTKQDGKNAGGSQGSGENSKRNSKDMTCFYCQKKGHKASECFMKQKDNKNKSNNQSNKQKVKKTQEEEEEWTVEEETVGKMDFPWMGASGSSL